jgi:PAS domain-containing protein
MPITECQDERRSRLLDALPAIAWSADARTFRFTYINPAAEKLLGYPAQRWLDEPNFWTEHLHPEDRHVARFWPAGTTSWSTGWSPPTAERSGCVIT